MKTVKYTRPAWLSCPSTDLSILLADPQAVSFDFPVCDMTPYGWAEVGVAEITVTLFSDDQLQQPTLQQLKEAIDLTNAQAQGKINELQKRIDALPAETPPA